MSAEDRATNGDARARIPAVSTVLDDPAVRDMIAEHSRPVVLAAIQDVLARLRASGVEEDTPVVELLRRQVEDEARNAVRRVINASGILLHTGLGRAVLPARAAQALGALNGCCNLQIDLETGLRGKRDYMCERLLALLTGAEAAMVVNNNAAATLLILAALCQGREVVVSRGQLIEIGGSFRLPDVVRQSGATLVEVGTTNKTHYRDYESAITQNTAAVMRVNPSNYRIIGFAKEVPIQDLVKLKQKHQVLVFDDLGCGALVDLRRYGLPHEPTVQESVAAGADLVCFSADKLIGGPQAGIIVGRSDLIKRIKKHPLTRALRVGKLTNVALEHSLRLFLDPDTLHETHPTLRMLAADVATLEKRAAAMVDRLRKQGCGLDVRAAPGESEVGGGSLPGVAIPTRVLAVKSASVSPEEVMKRLRRNDPPVIGRISEDEVLLDVRTLLEGEDAEVCEALMRIGS
jgi:L-seryl-tRNA(Ser) seleniumtransferase